VVLFLIVSCAAKARGMRSWGPLLLAVQVRAYGEGFGVLDAPVTNHSHCPAGSPQLVFAAPAGCATLLAPRKGAALQVPVVLTLDGVPGGDGGLGGAPCVQLQVRSSTQHAWYFMIPPAVRRDTVVTVCADAMAAGTNATAKVMAVAGDSAASAWMTTWTFRTRLHLGAGFHRLGARLDTGGRRGAAAHTARWGALSACAHEASAVLHVGVADEDGGGGGSGGGAKAAAEREALRATIAEKHGADEEEAEAARDRWHRLSGQYSELLGGSAGSEAAAAAHAELSAITSVLDGHGQEEEVLDPALLDALRSGEPARLAALLYEVPLGQRRDGTVAAAAGAASSPALALGGGGGGGGGALFGGGGAGGGGATGSNIFTLPMFTRSFGERLAHAIDEAKARFGDQMSAPNNGGAGYGFVLDEFGLGGLSHALAREVLAPLAQLVHPQWGSSALDGYHVFSLRVEGGEEEEEEEEKKKEKQEYRATHIDVCEISMNVCLGRAFRGSGMTFAGEDVGGQAADGVARSYVEHVPGRAILNLCQHHHAGSGTVGGERYSLVVRATSAEFRRSPAESFASRCLG
jgi:hypothetical protein